MNEHPYITLITCYHFGRANVDAYDLLLRSLRASVREIGSNGRLILVANGTECSAESPVSVIGDLPYECQKFVFPVTLQSNARNVGALNAGITYALTFSSNRDDLWDEWIGQVQSSVVLQPGWRANLFSRESAPDALFGRLVYEDDPSVIWADGHYLDSGRTYNEAFNEQISSGSSMPAVGTAIFPCLSAAVFRKVAVEAVVNKYGNFVFESLPHYGDCTDVALRLVTCGHHKFAFMPNAIAWKSRPIRDFTREAVSQLVAAQLYFKDRRIEAEEYLKRKKSTDGIR